MPPNARNLASRRASGPRSRYQAPHRGSSAAAWAIPAVLAALVLAVVLAVIRAHSGGTAGSQPVPPAVLAAATAVPQSAWDAVGTAGFDAAGKPGVTVPIGIAKDQRPASAPTVLYMGADFCPFCAATRWSLVATLSRFGSFSGLEITTSTAQDIFPNTPTFTFAKAHFQSGNVELQTVETADNAGKPLQTPTHAQQALLNTYDVPPFVSKSAAGTIPFILIGGRYLWSGSPFSPGLLTGKSWSDIASSLAAGQSDAAKAILANGNELAAAICAVNGGQPTDVCGSPGVVAAAKKLPAAGAA